MYLTLSQHLCDPRLNPDTHPLAEDQSTVTGVFLKIQGAKVQYTTGQIQQKPLPARFL